MRVVLILVWVSLVFDLAAVGLYEVPLILCFCVCYLCFDCFVGAAL